MKDNMSVHMPAQLLWFEVSLGIQSLVYRVYQKKLDTLVKPSQIIILWYKYESCSWICSLGSTQSDDIMSNDNISRLSEHWPF